MLYSEKLKTVLLLELTVPIEDRVLAAQSLKSKRYENLIRECQSNGWKASLLTIEIGCRGYISDSFKYILKQLGLSKLDSNLTFKQCSAIALRCSYILYLNRNQPSWRSMPYIASD